MEEKNIHDDLSAIRNLRERSQKFISLSGLSGILAGIYALAGAAAAYYLLYYGMPDELNPYVIKRSTIVTGLFYGGDDSYYPVLTVYLLLIAIAVLIASLSTGVFLTIKKAKRKGQAIWGSISRSLLF
jgi:hypothetical protein